ncbi:DUF1631 domain-containing protein [uncultured Marinobacter sp.]|uniref:DUF1631 domain-containing protein n=1 Tax=uncultured Marinobacter sp. TaxID=187379 RepID=UPI0030D6D5F0
MAQDNKVVSLREAQGQRVAIPATLVRLRDTSARALTKVLSDFFDSADDVLFGMADRAGSNQDQVAYFDAMRELRLRRKAMTNTVLQWVSRAFNEIGRFDPMPSSRGLEEVDQDSLTLMDDSELERKVAIEGLITKLGNRYGEQVRLLNARIAHATGLRSLADRQMPLSPEVICIGLGEASSELEIDIRARLVVIKLFDRLLVDRLEDLYREANRLLVTEGVLPDLRRAPVNGSSPVPKPGRSVPPSGREQSPGLDEDDPGGQYNFSDLTALLHQGEPAPRTSAGFSHGRGTLPVVDTAALMQQLSRLQGSSSITDGGDVLPLSSLLGRVIPSGPDRQLPVNQVDGDVINLVAMLFEFILDDRQLPSVMKMLIGRLQIPVLKVALLDRSFFNRGGHPARKLLNELANAGIGWSAKAEGQRDPLREKVEHVVSRLLNEFTDNVSLFSELLADFQHFMDLDRRRRELVEQRLRDAEEGRAKQELAQERIHGLLADLITGRSLPEKAVALMEEPWRKYLEWVFLRQGDDSPRWQSVVRLTERLVWTLDPQPVTGDTRAELLRAVPEITDALRAGLQEISWDPFAIDTAIRDLELAHVDVLQGLVAARKPAQEAAAPSDAGVAGTGEIPVLTGDSLNDQSDQEVYDPAADESVLAELDAQIQSAEALQQSRVSGPEITPTDAVEASAVNDSVAQAPEVSAEPAVAGSPWLERAAGMRVGCWVEMTRENDGGRLRCKLAAIIRATGKYIFVNRNGAKVAEYRIEELAETLASGKLTMLDDGLIFDRALESIIDNLRHNRKD